MKRLISVISLSILSVVAAFGQSQNVTINPSTGDLKVPIGPLALGFPSGYIVTGKTGSIVDLTLSTVYLPTSALHLGTLTGILNGTSGVVGVATIGSSLNYSGSTLNTAQGLRTVDSPTFAGVTAIAATGPFITAQTNATGGNPQFVATNNLSAKAILSVGGSAVGGTLFGVSLNGLATLVTDAGGSTYPTGVAIGTRNNTPVIFGVNNVEVGRFTSTGLNNTVIGASIPLAGSFTQGAFTQVGSTRSDGGYEYLLTNNAQTWGVAVGGSASDFRLDDITGAMGAMRLAAVTGQPKFPYLATAGAVVNSATTGALSTTTALPVAYLGGGSGASATTFWRGDGTWATASGTVTPLLTIAALKAVSVATLATNTSVNVLGYYSVGDGGGGVYVYNSGSSATDNGGTVIQPTSGSGRWLLNVIGNTVTVDQFGAVGDGDTTATDDRAKIQAALNWAATVTRSTVVLNAKTYAISDYLTINADYQTFVGRGQNTSRLLVKSAANDAIRVGQIGGPNIAVPTLGDFAISRNQTATGGTGIQLIKTSLAKVHDIQVSGCQNGFYFAAATNSSVIRCGAASNTTATNFIGFHWDGGQSGTTLLLAASSQMNLCFADATGCSGTSKGLLIDGNAIADIYVYDFGTLRCSYGKYIDGSRATSGPVVAANTVPYNWDLMFYNCTDDEFKTHGTVISANALIGAITIKSGWTNPGASVGTGSGIYVQNSRGVTIDGVQVMNISQIATARGITVDGSWNVHVKNCQVIDLNFGVFLLNSTMCSVDGNTVFNQSTMPGSTGILCSGATRNGILGNLIDGYNSTGISSDAASLCGNNLIANNHVNPDHVTPNTIIATGATGGADVSVNNITL